MNDRIKELENQCYSYAGFRDDTIVFNKEKFAELIVRDCANYVKNSNAFTYRNQADDCADSMLNLFGVQR